MRIVMFIIIAVAMMNILDILARLYPAKPVGIEKILISLVGSIAIVVFSTIVLTICGIFNIAYLGVGSIVILAIIKLAAKIKFDFPFFSFFLLRKIKERKLSKCSLLSIISILCFLLISFIYVFVSEKSLSEDSSYNQHELEAMNVFSSGAISTENNIEDTLSGIGYTFNDYAKNKTLPLEDYQQEEHLSPLYLGVLTSSFTIGGSFLMARSNVLIALFSIAFFYFFSKRLCGSRVALLAMIFLALFPTQIFGSVNQHQQQLTQLLLIISFSAGLFGWRYRKNSALYLSAGIQGLICLNDNIGFFLLVVTALLLIYVQLYEPDKARIIFKMSLAQFIISMLALALGITGTETVNNLNVEQWTMQISSIAFWLFFTFIYMLLRKSKISLEDKERRYSKHKKKYISILSVVIVLALIIVYMGVSLSQINNIKIDGYILFIALAVLGIYNVFLTLSKRRLEGFLPILSFGIILIIYLLITTKDTSRSIWYRQEWITVMNLLIALLAAVGISWKRVPKHICFDKREFKKERDGFKKVKNMVLPLFSIVYLIGFGTLQAEEFASKGISNENMQDYEIIGESLPANSILFLDEKYCEIAPELSRAYNKEIYILNSIEEREKNKKTILLNTPDSLNIKTFNEFLQKNTETFLFGDPISLWPYFKYQREDVILEPLFQEDGERQNESIGVYKLSPYDGIKPSCDLLDYVVKAATATENTQKRSIEANNKGYLFYGPYMDVAEGGYRITVDIESDEDVNANLSITTDAGAVEVATTEITKPGEYTLDFTLYGRAENFEVVLFNNVDNFIECSKINIEKIKNVKVSQLPDKIDFAEHEAEQQPEIEKMEELDLLEASICGANAYKEQGIGVIKEGAGFVLTSETKAFEPGNYYFKIAIDSEDGEFFDGFIDLTCNGTESQLEVFSINEIGAQMFQFTVYEKIDDLQIRLYSENKKVVICSELSLLCG